MAALFGGGAPTGEEPAGEGFGTAEFSAGGGATGAVPATSSSSFAAEAAGKDKPSHSLPELWGTLTLSWQQARATHLVNLLLFASGLAQ